MKNMSVKECIGARHNDETNFAQQLLASFNKEMSVNETST